MAALQGTPAEEALLELSIIIAVYNDWAALDSCLGSIAQQPPGFEVVVVDDGSSEDASENIRQWARHFPLTVVKQSHAGIAAARNRGIGAAKGAVLLFVDADCLLEMGCLAALTAAMARAPQHDCFQLRLTGTSCSVVGRAETLRLAAFQEYALQPDGRIRYLNTAGFAIRRARAEAETGLFDPAALRGEDTLLLAGLMQRNELPWFVPDATVRHDVRLSLTASLRKDVRSAWQEAQTYEAIAARGIRVRVTNGERLGLLASMWRMSGEPSIGRTAWFVLLIRQALQRAISFVCKVL
jgi:glycosyltransferase involved in cell wall biosynthesis